jgi:hypothetical protein
VIISAYRFLFYYLWAGLGLSPLGTSATSGPTVAVPVGDDDDDKFVE